MAASLEPRGCQPSAIPASRTSGSAIASAVGPKRSARLGRHAETSAPAKTASSDASTA